MQPALNAIAAHKQGEEKALHPVSLHFRLVEPLETNPTPKYESQRAVLGCLDRGGAVVTGNARAARWLRQMHTAAQRAAGRMAWPTPLIHDWDSWLVVLWNQHLQNVPDAPLLLTSLQERAVWKKIAGTPTVDSEAVVKLASKAWQLLSDFNAHGERRRSWGASVTSDAEVFRGWASDFDRECRANRWIGSQRSRRVAGYVNSAGDNLPAS